MEAQNYQNNNYKPVHILIVDDNVVLLRMVKEMLDDRFSVSIATSSTQTFKSIQKRLPDLIFLDYEMPYVNGEEIFKILRERNDTKCIPVFFLTGTADKNVVTKLVGLKPAGYMLKPPNKKKLIELIDKTLGIK